MYNTIGASFSKQCFFYSILRNIAFIPTCLSSTHRIYSISSNHKISISSLTVQIIRGNQWSMIFPKWECLKKAIVNLIILLLQDKIAIDKTIVLSYNNQFFNFLTGNHIWILRCPTVLVQQLLVYFLPHNKSLAVHRQYQHPLTLKETEEFHLNFLIFGWY